MNNLNKWFYGVWLYNFLVWVRVVSLGVSIASYSKVKGKKQIPKNVDEILKSYLFTVVIK